MTSSSSHVIRVVLAAAVCVAAQDAAAGWSNVYPMSPLHQLHNSGLQDNLYTVSKQTVSGAMSCCQYSYVGAAAWVPLNLPTDPVSYNDWLPSNFNRFWKGAPQYDHFYTTSYSDGQAVMNMGYQSEGNEGALFSVSHGSGFLPLYRLNRFNATTGDLIHAYTLSESERTAYQQQGWGFDGVQGYALTVPPTQSSGTGWNADANRRVHLNIPKLTNNGSLDNRENHRCTGYVEYYFNGSYGVVTDWSYGVLPGSFNTWGCYSTLPIATVAQRVSYPLRIIFGGAMGIYTETGQSTRMVKNPVDQTHNVYLY